MLYVTGNFETKKIKVNSKLLEGNGVFSWGVESPESEQLALSLLLLGTDKDNAKRLVNDFKTDYVMKFRKDKNFSYKIPLQRWLKAHNAPYKENKESLKVIPAGQGFGRTCGAFCTTAEGPECDCSCGGVNHGINRDVTVTNPKVEKTEKKTEKVDLKKAQELVDKSAVVLAFPKDKQVGKV